MKIEVDLDLLIQLCCYGIEHLNSLSKDLEKEYKATSVSDGIDHLARLVQVKEDKRLLTKYYLGLLEKSKETKPCLSREQFNNLTYEDCFKILQDLDYPTKSWDLMEYFIEEHFKENKNDN